MLKSARESTLDRLTALCEGDGETAQQVETQLYEKIVKPDTRLPWEKLQQLKTYNLASYLIFYDFNSTPGLSNALKKAKQNIELGRIGWNHDFFKQIREEVHEIREWIKNPIEIEEGIVTCKRCKSKRVFSYQKQTRSCDEPSTTFNECVKCGDKWTYSG